MPSVASIQKPQITANNLDTLSSVASSKAMNSEPIARSKVTLDKQVDTLNITLAPLPVVPTPFHYESLVVPCATLLGVLLTIWFGFRKTKMELNESALRANLERNHSREESNLNRRTMQTKRIKRG